jgi:hypothetical protein
MNAKRATATRSWISFSKKQLGRAVVLLLLPSVSAWAGGVVTNCTEVALRAAMVGGGLVTFACDGTITLASSISNSLDTVLDGSGHAVAISGNSAVRVFYVNSNVSLTLINLTVTGGGIFNNGGTVNLSAVALASCLADATNSATGGGAIQNELGTLNLRNCSFSGNQASGQPTVTVGASGLGGAIYNNGTMNASTCTFVNNWATGGPVFAPGSGGEEGAGGAVYNLGVAVIEGSTNRGRRDDSVL